MALQYSPALRDAQNDQIETVIGASPRAHIRSGPPPANTAAVDAGTLLVDIPLPADWLAASASGTKSKLGTWSATAIATGTAGHFRIKNSGATLTHVQGTITATGGGGDMTTDTIAINSGAVVSIDTFSVTRGNA